MVMLGKIRQLIGIKQFNFAKLFLYLSICSIMFSAFISSTQAYNYQRNEVSEDLTRAVRAPSMKWMRFGKRAPNGQKWMRFGKRNDEQLIDGGSGGNNAEFENLNVRYVLPWVN